MPSVTVCPRWDLTPFFPSIESEEFLESLKRLSKDVSTCEQVFDVAGIDAGANIDAFEHVFQTFCDLSDYFHLIKAYVEALTSADSSDAIAQARESEIDSLRSRLQTLDTRLATWLGKLDLDVLIERSELARAHAHFISRAQTRARKLMSPAEELLAAKLGPTGATAWAKLHGNVTSQIQVKVALPIGEEVLPMSAVRGLAYDGDRGVRKSAYEAELASWKLNEVPCAAAMNSIKGEVSILVALRGWASPLQRSLFDAAIDEQTLNAMCGAARESFPDFRRYLRAKAKLMGTPRLAWYDLFAPVGEGDQSWSYGDAAAFIERQFRNYSTKLGDFAARAFTESWVDAEPRVGKRDGAYCEDFRLGRSRIFMNFKPAFGSVSTLAHELGHAYHNMCLESRTIIQEHTPMTLAETASIFCETILKRAAISEATEGQTLAILEASLQGSCQVVVDIMSRFEFESGVFAHRSDRELSAQELCDLMSGAQRATYGDGLDESCMHPYMWAVKPHYYSSGLSFYNYPYMFGMLFALGLYAIYEESPEGFQDRYDNLLSRTGMNDVATLASEFGIDIRTPEFWRGSLNVIKQDIDRFEALVG